MFRNSYRISDPSLRQEVVDRKWAVKCQSNFFVKSLEWILDVALNPGYTCQDHFPKSKWSISLSWPVTPEGSWYKPSNSVFIDTIFAKQPRESNQVWERLRKRVRTGVHQFTVSCRLKAELRKSLRQKRSVKYAKENENKWIKLIWSPR